MPERVPYSPVPDTTPSLAGAPFQQINPPANAFGAGVAQATESLGAGLSEAGAQTEATAVHIASMNAETSARNANTQFIPALSKAWADYSQLEGENAAKALPDFQKKLLDIQKQTSGTLGSPLAQKMFMDQSAYMINRMSLLSAGHAAEQQKQAWKQSYTTNVENMTNYGVMMRNDQHSLDTAAQSVSDSVDDLGKNSGWDEAQTTATRAIALGKYWSHVIQAKSLDPAAGPAQAEALLDKVAPTMDAQSVNLMRQHLHGALDTGLANDAVTRHMAMSPAAGPVPAMISQTAVQVGIDAVRVLTAAKIESQLGQASDDLGNPHKGVFRMGDAEWRQYGGSPSERGDVPAQVRVGVSGYKQRTAELETSLGRPAQPWEAYMGWQQGAAGATSLITAAPTANVVDALTPAYKGDRAAATQAIINNGGRVNQTAGDFLGMWRAKYQDAEAAVGGTPVPTNAAPPPSPQSEAQVMQGILDDPALANRPEAMERALVLARTRFSIIKQTRQDAAEKAGSAFVTQLLKDPFKVNLNDIADNPDMTAEQKWNMSKMLNEAISGTRGDKQATEYGPGIYKYLQMVTPQPQTTPGFERNEQMPVGPQSAGMGVQLSDPTQLWPKVQTGELTIAGVEKLTSIMQGGKTLDGQNDNRMLTQFIDTTKQMISKHGAFGGLQRDPKGEQLFEDFLTQALPAFSAGRQAGKSAADLLNSKSPDYIGKIIPQYIRSQSAITKDLLDANSEDADVGSAIGKGGVATPGVDVTTREGVESAYKAKKIGYFEAERALKALGILSAPTNTTPLSGSMLVPHESSTHIDDAQSVLNMTPQERNLYQHHVNNLGGPGAVHNQDGSTSTILQTSVERDGKFYNIPTVWDSKILPPSEAIKRAERTGWSHWPSYSSEDEAESRYQKMHEFMDRDVGERGR